MDLKLNSLPARTWNRLGMNESFLSLEAGFEPRSPRAEFDAAQVSWSPDAHWAGEPVALGTGEDVRALTESAPVGLAETAPGAVMDSPIILTWDYRNSENAVSRIVLRAAENSTLSAVLVLRTGDLKDSGASAVRTEVYAGKNSRVNVYVAQLMGSGCVCLNDVSGVCEENAAVTLTKLELGAGKLYAGAHFDLKGKNSSFTSEVGCHVHPGQLLDMNYVALHHGRSTSSLMTVNGTLEEGGRKVFRGTIDFQQGCAGARGTENENVLLMGEDMVNQTIPLILCKEEDVEGNHGASIGQLDDKVLFYLSTRGMSPRQAKQMIARSRIEAVCSKLPAESVRELVHTFEEKRGDSLETVSE